MKQTINNYFVVALAIMLGITLFSLSCTGKQENAATAFADTTPAVKIPADALSVTESLQSVFRAVSEGVLPTVVELDVVETKKLQNRYEDFPFFFFNQEGEESEEKEYKQSGLGSGVIVRRSGKKLYILTNNHVVSSATEISVKLNDGRSFIGTLVGSDERKDIALVSFESEDVSIPVATFGDSDTVHTGDICFAMGTPLGYGSSVTQGIISATGRSGGGVNNISDFIQSDAAINQGNSGGPLVNIYGEIIGINTWIASQSGGSQGLGFSIPINNIKKAIDDFISGGKVTYGWLGCSLMAVEDVYKEALGVNGKNGVFVAQIFLDSPAFKAGIQAGDYILTLNRKDIKSVEQLNREIGDLPVGQTAAFTIMRNGKQVDVKAKIEERNSKIVADSSKMWPGFIASPLTDDLRKQLKLDNKVSGIVVFNVEPKTPAAVLSLQGGDVITAVNDKAVKNVKEFYGVLASAGSKESWFDIVRNGHTIVTSKYKR